MKTQAIVNRSRRSRASLATCIAGCGVLFASAALATGPNLPVEVVKANKAGAVRDARLQYEVAANSAEVVDLEISSAVESKGQRHIKRDVAARALPAPAANTSAQAKVPGPVFVIEGLPDGVYAHVVEVRAKLRGAGAASKPVAITSLDYFKIAGGQVTFISADEYTAAVDPTEQVTLPGGNVVSEHRGLAVERGLSRSNVLGTTPIGKSLDAPTQPASVRTGRRN